MRIAVLGAGAMGSLFGGLLAESGEEVTLIDINEAHLDAIRRDGLRLDTDGGDRRVTSLVAARPAAVSEAPDLLIVFTKTLHTAAALDGIAHLVTERTHVLSLQNGLGNLETIARFVPTERILIGVTNWPADMVGPGHVRSHGAGSIRMMTADGVARPVLAECVAALAGAGLQCEADPQIWVSVWQKVAFNAALNSLCAVVGCPVDGLDAVPEGRALALRIVGEVIAVARAQGVAVDLDKTCATVAHAITHHRGHKPSMLQDVLAGRQTEVGSINGAVVAAGRQVGVPTPCTESLLGMVRLIESQA